MSKTKPFTSAGKGQTKPAASATPVSHNPFASRATRETVESIVIAIILAFMFRAFEAEAFVIPTGSMADTLMGRHMDVQCPECGYWYRAGASVENDEGNGRAGEIVATTCPICRFTMPIDDNDPNQDSFTGDRILVSKFAFELGEPQRWDVIVFKFPGNAKQNYIKRLVGLPHETIKIQYGNIYIQREGESKFQIARKPPHKLKAMLQLVDDTNHIAADFRDPAIRWPSRWQEWSPDQAGGPASWTTSEDGHEFATAGAAGRESWLRYRHLIPSYEDWEEIEKGRRPVGLDRRQGQLISDYYAYNDSSVGGRNADQWHDGQTQGLHWVGDLALECNVTVENESGELILDLVEGGKHYQCRIDVATGKAVLSIDGGRELFTGDDGNEVQHPTAETRVRGSGGSYHLRFSNVDDELRLWVNERLVQFDNPTTYVSSGGESPAFTTADPLDAAPAGVGSKGTALRVSRLRILRDIYYIAASRIAGNYSDYDVEFPASTPQSIREDLMDPTRWANSPLFAPGARRARVESMGEDHFFPLGDNSPQSQDARLWPGDPYVERELLIGKAVLIYWPHHWRRPIPFMPNFARMGFIR
jgi:signal peptidase I